MCKCTATLWLECFQQARKISGETLTNERFSNRFPTLKPARISAPAEEQDLFICKPRGQERRLSHISQPHFKQATQALT